MCVLFTGNLADIVIDRVIMIIKRVININLKLTLETMLKIIHILVRPNRLGPIRAARFHIPSRDPEKKGMHTIQ